MALSNGMDSRKSPAGFLELSPELICDILERVEADPYKFVTLDRRAYLSVESFSLPPRQLPKPQETIGNFRLTCRRFSELGAMYQLPRVTTRFSKKGLKRLDWLATQPHLARHVKKFCYMVPYFFKEGGDGSRDIPADLRNHFSSKLAEQRDILSSEEDTKALTRAMRAFTSLQHVQILRVLEQQDGDLLRCIRQQPQLGQSIQLNWTPACTHCTQSIGAALLAAGNSCTQFSNPMLSPQSAHALSQAPLQKIIPLAKRFTCLTIHFDDPDDLNDRIRDLRGLFKAVFEAAKDMQAVHVGFPSHRPLSLPLEDIFNHVKWDKLVCLGIQSMRLEGDEIIEIARRHRDRLKGLRLRDVQLKEGSRWKHVLGWLRDNMPRLEWVSLRRIGYAKYFDEQMAIEGVEVPDEPGGPSDSDSDSDNDDDFFYEEDEDDDTPTPSGSTPVNGIHPPPGGVNNGFWHTNGDGAPSDDDHSDSDESEGPNSVQYSQDIDFPIMSPDTPNSATWCNCNVNSEGRRQYPDSADDLGDDGVFVTNTQRKLWESWVVRRCPEHSPPKQ